MTPPLLGIWASQITGRLWEPQGAYDALATVTVPSGGSSSITFAGIPTGYKHLQLRVISKTSATSGGSISMTFNSDSASNYSMHGLSGNGASASAYGFSGETRMYVGYGVQDTGQFSALIIDILEYANTNINKTARILSGLDTNGAGIMGLLSGNWRSTSAINTITLTPQSANFSQYSHFALYGVK